MVQFLVLPNVRVIYERVVYRMRRRVATYKAWYVDGREREVIAQRLSTDHDCTTFEIRREGSWQKLAQVANRDVETVRQRITEANGSFRWVTARPARQAHGYSAKDWR
jgi:hypothetical protein